MRAVVVAVLLIPALARAEATRKYTVVAGDTCLGIANRELGDPAKLTALHAANPQLGKLPHKLVPGQILNLPATGPVTADAHLRATRGRVEVLPSGTETWDAGAIGQELFRTWRVGTRAKATAKVEFVDLSTIDMREDTVVMIFGPTSGRSSTLRTELERGILRTRLAALDRKVIVDTPAGKAEVGQGSAVIDVDTAKETRLANHGGKPARLSNARGKTELAAGYGSRAVADKPPSPPILLLPPPRWESTGELALAWQGDPITLRGRWTAVPGAVKYRIEIARSTSPLEAESQVEVPATITRLEATGLPAASYLVTVASVDRDGLEGVPSAPLLIQSGEVPRPTAIAGAVFEPPAGLRCARGTLPPVADPVPPVVLVREPAGELAPITCASVAGHSTLELALPPPRIAVTSRELVRGELATIGVDVGEVELSRLQIIGHAVTILHAARRASGFDLQLVAPAAGTAQLAFVIDGVTIASEALAVVEPREELAPVTPGGGRSSWRWGAGVYAGGTTARTVDSALLGAELWLAGRPWLAGYLGISKLAEDREGIAHAGVRTALEGQLRPVARAGVVVVGSQRVGGELGLGIELGWRNLAISVEAAAVGDSSDRYVRGVMGLTLSR